MSSRGKPGVARRIGAMLDQAIGVFAPVAAMRRMMARNSMGQIQALTGAYAGARKDRTTDDWDTTKGSADADLEFDLPTLRERSRALNRNDGNASGLTSSVVNHAVGKGLKPQSRIDYKALGITQEAAAEWQRATEAIWDEWSPGADSGERLSFAGIQQLAKRQMLESGEALVRPVMVRGREIELAAEVIEPDRLETPWVTLPAGKDVRQGIEMGPRGEPRTYYIRKMHPGEAGAYMNADSLTYQPIPAKTAAGRPGILHLYRVLRPGQSRGVPFFAPILKRFYNLARYEESEEVAARVAACFAAFVTKANPVNSLLSNAPEIKNSRRVEELEPAMIEYLQEGESISFGNPTRPSAGFEPFVTQMLRGIGAALNLPYEIVAQDFSKTNYSSARAALLEAWLMFDVMQDYLAQSLCQPFWNMLVEEAWLKGLLPRVPFYDAPQLWCAARWIGPGMAWVDPLKEVQAARERVSLGISTLTDEAAARGLDFEDVCIQRKREQDLVKELGIEPMEPKTPPSGGGAPPAEPEDETEDEPPANRRGGKEPRVA